MPESFCPFGENLLKPLFVFLLPMHFVISFLYSFWQNRGLGRTRVECQVMEVLYQLF